MAGSILTSHFFILNYATHFILGAIILYFIFKKIYNKFDENYQTFWENDDERI